MSVRHISLLRGINVGGHNLVPMARLRSMYVALGCHDVTTYLQSGNVVFRHEDDPGGVATAVEAALKDELGLDVRVLGRTHAELAGIVAADPFPSAEPNQRIVLFLSATPATTVARELGHLHDDPDEAILIGEEFHLYVPGGLGRSRLVQRLGDRRLGVTSTGRNWRTVSRLLELSGE